jgi:F0F1-type ATP synthase delta subunit
MKKVSRRELAKTATRQLLEGKDPKRVMLEMAAYLIDHKAANQADMVLSDISMALQEATGHVSAEVVSAFAIGSENRRMIEEYLKAATKATSVEMTVVEDKSLMGGVVLKTPGHEYDASVRRKLNLLARGEA